MGGICRADVDGRPPSSPSKFVSGKKEWTVVSRDDVESLIAMTSHRRKVQTFIKTYKLPDDNIMGSR